MEQRRSQSIVQDKSFHVAVQIVGYIRRQLRVLSCVILTRRHNPASADSRVQPSIQHSELSSS
jgi:hypothetical protein